MLVCGACRFWQSYLRDVPYNGTRFVFAGVLAVLFGLILLNVNHPPALFFYTHPFYIFSAAAYSGCLDQMLKHAFQEVVSRANMP